MLVQHTLLKVLVEKLLLLYALWNHLIDYIKSDLSRGPSSFLWFQQNNHSNSSGCPDCHCCNQGLPHTEWGDHSFGTFHIQGPLAASSAALYSTLTCPWKKMAGEPWNVGHILGSSGLGPPWDRGTYYHIMTDAINLTKPWNVTRGPHEHWSETFICCLSGN